MLSTLNMDMLPTYCFSAFRYFDEGEKHVTRICEQDVLLLVFDGVLRFHEGGKPIEVNKGQFYIQKSGLFQEGLRTSDCPKYYYIHFYGNFREGKNRLPLMGAVNFTNLYPLIQTLDFLCLSGAPAIETNAVFYSILSELSKSFKNAAKQKLILKIIALVSQDIKNVPSLDALAKVCGYSKNHIINIFKSETGQTPYRYINKLKMDIAKQLLVNSEMPITQIAIECGFGSYTNMYKEFLNKEKYSPKQWRQSHIGTKKSLP